MKETNEIKQKKQKQSFFKDFFRVAPSFWSHSLQPRRPTVNAVVSCALQMRPKADSTASESFLATNADLGYRARLAAYALDDAINGRAPESGKMSTFVHCEFVTLFFVAKNPLNPFP
jgi:hypothetical protein